MATEQEMLSEAVSSTETEIFNEAFQDEATQPETETPEVEETMADKTPRDETGKFKAKESEKPSEVKAEEAKPAEAKVDAEKTEDDDKGQVPSWRLREVAEERRALQAERDKLTSELAQMRAEIAGLKKPAEQPKLETIDPLLDPEGFSKRLQDGFEAKLREVTLNNNLALAHVRHGEKFEKAYNALIAEAQAGNRQIVPHLTGQPNPGEAIVKWYSDRETLKEVGSDPAAYKNKLLEDALKDPSFLAKAIEAAKSSAGGQQRPNNITQLPPSLSRTPGASKNIDPTDTDDSDRAVFEYAFR